MKTYTLLSSPIIDEILENIEPPYNNIKYLFVLVANVSKYGILFPSLKIEEIFVPTKTKILSKKDRLIKNAHVEIIIDQVFWDEADDIEKEAIIAHALQRVLIVEDNTGAPKLDENNDMILKINPYNMVFFGYSKIAYKYKDNSIEIKNFKKLLLDYNHILTI